MIFSILIILSFLVLIGCAAAIGHFKLEARARRSYREALEERLANPDVVRAQPPVEPAPSPTPPTTASTQTSNALRVVLVTANPGVSFSTGSQADRDPPIPFGTLLFRGTEGRWMGAHRPLSDTEVNSLVRSGYASDQPITTLTDGNLRNFNVAVERFRQLGHLQTANAMDTFRAFQNSFQADLQNITRDFARAFPGATVTTTTRTSTNMREDPHPPTGAVQKAAPKPKDRTPKSAIDRLLEDELISDDDSGVKPES